MKSIFKYHSISLFKNSLLALLSLLFFSTSCKQKISAFKQDQFLLSFSNLSFDAHDVSFGDSSDVIVPGLPKDVLTVFYNPSINKFIWQTKQPIYFWIAGKNPNSIDIKNVNALIINDIEIPITEFENELNAIDNQNYLPLSKLLKKVRGNIQTQNINSVYSKEKHVFILLDTIVKLRNKSAKIIAYKYSDTLNLSTIQLEFFKTISFSNFPTNKSRNHLRINDTCFHIKVEPYFTNFGASIFYISKSETKKALEIFVALNKPYQYCYSKSTLEQKLLENGQIPINIVQDYQGSSFGSDLVVPSFSYSKNYSLGQFESTQIEPTNLNCLTYTKVPVLINYLVPLLSIFLLLFVFFTCMNKSKTPILKFLSNYLYLPHNNRQEIDSWRNHFLWLLTILSVFLIYRIFIAYQLSYTGPYFFNLLPVQTAIAPLILITVYWGWTSFALSFCVSKDLKRIKDIRNARGLNLLWILLLLVAMSLIIYYLTDVKQTLSIYFRNQFSLFRFAKNLKSELGSLFTFIYLIPALFLYESFQIFKESRMIKTKKTVKGYRIGGLFIPVVVLLFLSLLLDNAYSAFVLLVLLILQYIIFSNSIQSKFTNYFKDRPTLVNLKIKKIDFSISRVSFITIILSWAAIGFVFLFTWLVKKDAGYFINLLFLLLVAPICYLFRSKGKNWDTEFLNLRGGVYATGLLVGLCLFGLLKLGTCHASSISDDPIETLKSTTDSRLTTFYDFQKMREFGLKKSESIVQFFAVLSKYSKPISDSEQSNRFHSAISGFSDPVVINDLSFPAAGIAPWGKFFWMVLICIFTLWILLIRTVAKRTFYPHSLYDAPTENNSNQLTTFGVIRLICLAYLVGSGFWLILSYYGLVPFTGRLIFGLGQDSVAEVLETIILYIGMGIIYSSPSPQKKMNNLDNGQHCR